MRKRVARSSSKMWSASIRSLPQRRCPMPAVSFPSWRGSPRWARVRRASPVSGHGRVQSPGGILSRRGRERGWGSSAWGVAASHTAEGVPLIAYDPHLSATSPAGTYEIHLVAEQDPRYGKVNLSGMSFPGSPGVASGQNDHVAWGFTTNFSDHGDFFWDRLIRGDPRCSAPLCIESAGELHPVEERSETYRMNDVGNGVSDNTIDMTALIALLAPHAVNVLSVPFRSFGPIIEVEDRSVVDDPGESPAQTTALTVQSTRFTAAREVGASLSPLRAQNVYEFDAGTGSTAHPATMCSRIAPVGSPTSNGW